MFLLFLLFFFFIKISSGILNDFNWPINHIDKCSIFHNIVKNNSKCIIHSCNSTYSIKNRIHNFDLSNHFIISMIPISVNNIENNIENNRNNLIHSLNTIHIKNKNNYALINYIYNHGLVGFSAILSPDALQLVIKNDFVHIIEQDQYTHSLIFQRNPIWNLDRIDQKTNKLNNLFDTGILNGDGVDIYILDTGINKNHNEFKGRIGIGKNFINDNNGWNDCNGHGTHCAGTIGGTKWGVAKKSIVHAVRILNCD